MRILTLILCAALATAAQARDMDGLSESLSDEQKAWVKGITSQNGVPCCDEADGYDVQWFITDNHYVVVIDGETIDVPPEAVITAPSKLLRARVWYVPSGSGKFIRCFVPGTLY